MKNIITIIQIFLIFSISLNAQQTFLLTQYTENQSIINPASISIDYLDYQQKRSVGVTYRYQWTGIEDAPRTTYAKFDMINEGDNLAVFGGMIMSDKIGATSQTGIFGRYAYHIRPSIGADLLIGFGLSFGVIQYRIDGKNLEFESNDLLAADTPRRFLPDFGVGANIAFFPESGTKFYAGLSMPQTIGLDAKFRTENDEEFAIKRLRHFYTIAGAIIPIGQQGFLEPSIWLKKTKNTPTHIDFNIRQKFANDFWIGTGYSTSNALHFETGIILIQLIGLEDALLRVGYGFDYNLTQYNQYLGASHELNVSFAW